MIKWKGHKDKQYRKPPHRYPKNWAKRTPLKTGMNSYAPEEEKFLIYRLQLTNIHIYHDSSLVSWDPFLAVFVFKSPLFPISYGTFVWNAIKFLKKSLKVPKSNQKSQAEEGLTIQWQKKQKDQQRSTNLHRKQTNEQHEPN